MEHIKKKLCRVGYEALEKALMEDMQMIESNKMRSGLSGIIKTVYEIGYQDGWRDSSKITKN